MSKEKLDIHNNYRDDLETLKMTIEFEEGSTKHFVIRVNEESKLDEVKALLIKNNFTVHEIKLATFYQKNIGGLSQSDILGMGQSYGYGSKLPEGFPPPPIAFVILQSEFEKLSNSDKGFVARMRQDFAYTVRIDV